MKLSPTKIPDVIVIEPDVFRDDRGFFLETYQSKKYAAAGLPARFVQDNNSFSFKHALRGLHAQSRIPQGKLIRVMSGEIFDVAVDVRPNSPTFGQWTSARLSAENFKQMYIPPGFLHGFCVVSDQALVEYKCTELYDKADEVGVRWDDPDLKISWPTPSPIVSPKDQALPSFSEFKSKLKKT